MEQWFQIAQFVAAVATAVSVAVAAAQLREQRNQQLTSFEDRLNEEYREIIADLPLVALLNGRHTSDGEIDDGAIKVFYRYFDLCNEQLFLRDQGKVSENTWKNWEDGIRQNLARPQFRSAWNRIAQDCPGFFEKLRLLVPPVGRPASDDTQAAEGAAHASMSETIRKDGGIIE